MKYFLLFIIASIACSFSYAGCSGNSCTDVTITRLYTIADGSTVISTSGDESQLDCDAGNSGYITLEPEKKNYNATYSLLLAAHISDMPIWVRASDSGECQVVYVVSDR